MGTRKFHVMNNPDKKGEGYIRVPLNAWAARRRQGYEFVSAEDEAKEKERQHDLAAKQKASSKSKSKSKDK